MSCNKDGHLPIGFGDTVVCEICEKTLYNEADQTEPCVEDLISKLNKLDPVQAG